MFPCGHEILGLGPILLLKCRVNVLSRAWVIERCLSSLRARAFVKERRAEGLGHCSKWSSRFALRGSRKYLKLDGGGVLALAHCSVVDAKKGPFSSWNSQEVALNGKKCRNSQLWLLPQVEMEIEAGRPLSGLTCFRTHQW